LFDHYNSKNHNSQCSLWESNPPSALYENAAFKQIAKRAR
jgi:hypothetical protein